MAKEAKAKGFLLHLKPMPRAFCSTVAMTAAQGESRVLPTLRELATTFRDAPSEGPCSRVLDSPSFP